MTLYLTHSHVIKLLLIGEYRHDRNRPVLYLLYQSMYVCYRRRRMLQYFKEKTWLLIEITSSAE